MEAHMRAFPSGEQWEAAIKDPDFWKMRKAGQVPFNWEATPGRPKTRSRQAYDSDDSQSVRSATGAGDSDEDSGHLKLKPPPSFRSFRDRSDRRYAPHSDTDSCGWSSDTPALVAQYGMSSEDRNTSDASNLSDSATPVPAPWLAPRRAPGPRSADRFYDAQVEPPRMGPVADSRKLESDGGPQRLGRSGHMPAFYATELASSGTETGAHLQSDNSSGDGKALSDMSPTSSTNLSTRAVGNRSPGGEDNPFADFAPGRTMVDDGLARQGVRRNPPLRKRGGGPGGGAGTNLTPMAEEAHSRQCHAQGEGENCMPFRDVDGYGGHNGAYENGGAIPVREAILQRFLIAADAMAARCSEGGRSQPSSVGSESELASEHGASYSTTSSETLQASLPPMPSSREPLWGLPSGNGTHTRGLSSDSESDLQAQGARAPPPPERPKRGAKTGWQHKRVSSSGTDESDCGERESSEFGKKASGHWKGPNVKSGIGREGDAAVSDSDGSARDRGVPGLRTEVAAQPQASNGATDSDSDDEYGGRSAASFAGGLLTGKRSLTGMALASMLCGVPARNLGFSVARSHPSPPSTPSSTRSAENARQFDHYVDGQGRESSAGSRSPSSKGSRGKKEKPPLPPGHDGAAEKGNGKMGLFSRLLSRNGSKSSNALPPSAPRRSAPAPTPSHTRPSTSDATNFAPPPVDTRPAPSQRAISRRNRSLSRELFPEIDTTPIHESELATAQSPFKTRLSSQPGSPSKAFEPGFPDEEDSGWFSPKASFDASDPDSASLNHSVSTAAMAAAEAAATAAAMASAAVDAAKEAPSPTKKGTSPGASPIYGHEGGSTGPFAMEFPSSPDVFSSPRGARAPGSPAGDASPNAELKGDASPHSRAQSLPETMQQDWQDRMPILSKSLSMNSAQVAESSKRDRRRPGHAAVELSDADKEKLWVSWEQEVQKLDTIQAHLDAGAAAIAARDTLPPFSGPADDFRGREEMGEDEIKWAADSRRNSGFTRSSGNLENVGPRSAAHSEIQSVGNRVPRFEAGPEFRSAGSLSPLVLHGRVQSMELVPQECAWNPVDVGSSAEKEGGGDSGAASRSVRERMRALEEKMNADERLLRESRARNARDLSSAGAEERENQEWEWQEGKQNSAFGAVGPRQGKAGGERGGGEVDEREWRGAGSRPGERQRSGVLMDWDPNPLGWEGINMDRLSLYCSNMLKDSPSPPRLPRPSPLHVNVRKSQLGREEGSRAEREPGAGGEDDERDVTPTGSPQHLRRRDPESPPSQYATNSPSPRGRNPGKPWEMPWDRWSTPALDEEAESYEPEMRRRAAPILTLSDSPRTRTSGKGLERDAVSCGVAPDCFVQKHAPQPSPELSTSGSHRQHCPSGTPPRPRASGESANKLHQNSRTVDMHGSSPSTTGSVPPGSRDPSPTSVLDADVGCWKANGDLAREYAGKAGARRGGPSDDRGAHWGEESSPDREEYLSKEYMTPPGSPYLDPVAELWGMSSKDHPRKSGIPLAPHKGLSAAQAQLANLTLNEKLTPETSTMWASTESESRAIDLLISGAPILFMM